MPNPKPFLTHPAVSDCRDSEQSGGAVKHTQTPEKCASLLSTKNQNGLRNQFDATPYKPPTAQCESAPQPPYLQKIQSLTKPQSKNKPQKTHKTHFREKPEKAQKNPRFQPPKPQKNTRANTPRVIFITSRTNLSINEKPTSEGSRHTTRDSRFQD